MGIDYTTTPRNFDELCDSTRGQVERTRELAMKGEELPPDEAVVMTSEAFLSMLDKIESLCQVVDHQSSMFSHMEVMFRWLFAQMGVSIDELIDEEDGDYEGEEG